MFAMVASVKLDRVVAWTMTVLGVAPFWWGCAKPAVTVHQMLTGSPALAGSATVQVLSETSATDHVKSQESRVKSQESRVLRGIITDRQSRHIEAKLDDIFYRRQIRLSDECLAD